jgi:SAM-dependent methyltransferase
MVDSYLSENLVCPICRNNLFLNGQKIQCKIDCLYSKDIPQIYGKLILIDPEKSIIDFDYLLKAEAQSPIKRNLKNHNLKRRIKDILWGNAKRSKDNFQFITEKLSTISKPYILVVGGGTIGDGMDKLYENYSDSICSFDVFYSDFIDIIADGHQIPFVDGLFDLVIIQAVLEHVLEPKIVVAEIYRVLKSNGIVYAETPFLQQVHEGAYDYTRFTELGHINLFNHFKVLKSGYLNGLGTSLLWSIDYISRGLFRSKIVGKIFKILFFWVRFLDYLVPSGNNIDGACGLYYVGEKSEKKLKPKEILKLYKGAQ